MSDLPLPGDPYIMGVGDVYTEDNKDVASTVDDTLQRSVVQRFVTFAPVRKVSTDATPEADSDMQKAISLVIALRLMGMDNVSIAETAGVTVGEIDRISQLPATQHTFELMIRNVIGNNSNNIQGRIASHANGAIATVIELMEDVETRSDVRLKAAQDVLDRSGTGAREFFSNEMDQQGREDELNIVIMDDENEKERVKINMKRK